MLVRSSRQRVLQPTSTWRDGYGSRLCCVKGGQKVCQKGATAGGGSSASPSQRTAPTHLVDESVVGGPHPLQEEVVAAEALAVALQQKHGHRQQAAQHVGQAVAELGVCVRGWIGWDSRSGSEVVCYRIKRP